MLDISISRMRRKSKKLSPTQKPMLNLKTEAWAYFLFLCGGDMCLLPEFTQCTISVPKAANEIQQTLKAQYTMIASVNPCIDTYRMAFQFNICNYGDRTKKTNCVKPILSPY